MAQHPRASILKTTVTLVTLLAFVATIFGIRWLVATKRPPGAITVIEAQAMDMSAMKAPPGEQPVATEKPTSTQVGGRQSFPATIMAFSDEEIVARVPGKVLTLAYPGDHVKAGQVVARLDAAEYFAQERQSRFQADSNKSTFQASSQETEVLRATMVRTEADLDAAKVGIAKSESERLMAQQEVQKSQEEAEAKRAEVKARQADLTYAEASRGRQESLYRQGFTSLDQYQVAQRARDSAKANLEATQAEALAKDRASQAAAAKVAAMGKEVDQAKAEAKAAQVAVTEASRQVEKSKSEARASADQAKAAKSQLDSAATMASYTQLRSLDNCMVAERFVGPGAVVVAGQKLLMLHNAEKVRVQAQVPEAMAPQILQGTAVTIHYGTVEKSASITSVFPTADTATRTFTVEALIDNPQHRYLPGSFATMSIETQAAQQRLAVRSSAIQMDASGNPFVWIVRESAGQKTDWTCPMHSEVSEHGPGKCPICKMDLVPRSRGGKTFASRREVKTGPTDGELTAITEGLSPTDLVIWAGFDGLIEGSPVKSVAWGSGGPTQLPAIGETPTSHPSKPASPDHRQLWTCPMHPEVVEDHPGKCPKCGMDLVPKKAGR